MPSAKSPEDKMTRINVWLTPDLLTWLQQTIDTHNQKSPYDQVNTSLYIRRLLAKEMTRDN